jgi:hypothetical protein
MLSGLVATELLAKSVGIAAVKDRISDTYYANIVILPRKRVSKLALAAFVSEDVFKNPVRKAKMRAVQYYRNARGDKYGFFYYPDTFARTVVYCRYNYSIVAALFGVIDSVLDRFRVSASDEIFDI